MLQDEVVTLGDVPRHHARERPDAAALVFGDRTLTYGALDAASNRVAQALAASGIEPGARVATLARDSDHLWEAIFGVAKAGAVLQGVSWKLKPDELAGILEDGEAELVLVGTDLVATLEEIAPRLPRLRGAVVLGGEASGSWPAYDAWRDACPAVDPDRRRDPDEVVVQMHTSGTTGRPKGVQLAHRSFFAVVRSMAAVGDPWIGLEAGDTTLFTLPSFHVGGLWLGITALAAGARNIVLDAFVAWRALGLMERERVTKTWMVPAMIQMVLAEPDAATADLGSLDTLVYGGSPISAALLERAARRFGCELFQIYGLTETGNTAVCLRPADHVDLGSERVRAAGRPYPCVSIRCVGRDGRDVAVREVGEIWIRSPANMVGYWKRPEATAETLIDGWVRTGDAGYLDEDGYVYVCDRVKDMIICAGENIYPAEIEAALAEHPAVAECAVIGVPDERWGEAVKAIVVLADGATATGRDLIRHVRARLADYKVPRTVDLVERLPRTASGKVQKAELRAPYWAARERQVN